MPIRNESRNDEGEAIYRGGMKRHGPRPLQAHCFRFCLHLHPSEKHEFPRNLRENVPRVMALLMLACAIWAGLPRPGWLGLVLVRLALVKLAWLSWRGLGYTSFAKVELPCASQSRPCLYELTWLAWPKLGWSGRCPGWLGPMVGLSRAGVPS